jgi:hypothetical protein
MIIKKISPVKPVAQQNGKLLLFFAGWGMDEHPFMGYDTPGYDLAIVYGYDTLSLDETALKPYSGIKVVAWSMGVWAASQWLQDKKYAVAESIAINGTHFPVDDRRGIPCGIFEGTLNGLDENTLYRFRRRMCGSGDALKRFLDNAPQRSIESLKRELTSIGESTLRLPPSQFEWSTVYIGGHDRIFPVANQMNAWEGANCIMTDEAHYPAGLWKRIFNGKERQA